MKTTNKLLITFLTIITLTSCSPNEDECSVNYTVVTEVQTNFTSIELDYCTYTFNAVSLSGLDASGIFTIEYVLDQTAVNLYNNVTQLYSNLLFTVNDNDKTITVTRR